MPKKWSFRKNHPFMAGCSTLAHSDTVPYTWGSSHPRRIKLESAFFFPPEKYRDANQHYWAVILAAEHWVLNGMLLCFINLHLHGVPNILHGLGCSLIRILKHKKSCVIKAASLLKAHASIRWNWHATEMVDRSHEVWWWFIVFMTISFVQHHKCIAAQWALARHT